MKIVLPSQDELLVLASGAVNPNWYIKLKMLAGLADKVAALEARGLLDMPDVDNSTPITNGQVLIFDSTSGKFKPGAN